MINSVALAKMILAMTKCCPLEARDLPSDGLSNFKLSKKGRDLEDTKIQFMQNHISNDSSVKDTELRTGIYKLP